MLSIEPLEERTLLSLSAPLDPAGMSNQQPTDVALASTIEVTTNNIGTFGASGCRYCDHQRPRRAVVGFNHVEQRPRARPNR